MNNITKINVAYHDNINEFKNHKMNMIITKPINVVNAMNNENLTQCNDSKGIIKVILQFPDKPSDDALLKEEVREILNKALFEQLDNQTYKTTL